MALSSFGTPMMAITPLQIIGQHVQRHLGGHVLESPHLEVRRAQSHRG
jgi:hypothetical protein